MAIVTIRKPDCRGVRVDVDFEDRNDAEAVWMYRNRPEWLVPIITCKSDSRYKMTDGIMWFANEAAVLAAREYLQGDPLDERAPT
jgi:hypothetical protein